MNAHLAPDARDMRFCTRVPSEPKALLIDSPDEYARLRAYAVALEGYIRERKHRHNHGAPMETAYVLTGAALTSLRDELQRVQDAIAAYETLAGIRERA